LATRTKASVLVQASASVEMAGRHGQNGAISPALLTSLIKQARTIEALFCTCSEHMCDFNHIHLSACWNSLGHLARGSGQALYDKENAKALESLVQHTLQTLSKEQTPARQLVNIAHGVARSGRGLTEKALMKALAKSIMRRLNDCNPQELANAAWAFAKSGFLDAQLFMGFATTAKGLADNFNAQELANTLWAFATAGHADEKLFMTLARAVEWRLDDFNAQGFANTSWAFAKVGVVDVQLFSAMARSAEWHFDNFNAQDLAQIAWAFAKVGHADAQLFKALSRLSEQRLGDFSAQGLATLVWAFAKASQADTHLFTTLARSIEKRLSNFNAQDLANIAWAFAKACQVDLQLFTALARPVKDRLNDFNAQDLVNTAWAYAKIGQLDMQLFSAIARSIECRLGDFNAQHLASTAWAFAKAGQLDAQFLKVLEKEAKRRLGDFSAQDVANIAWAFANAGQLDAQLFAALAKSAERCLEDFNDEELENTAWAFAKAGQQGIAKRLRQRGDAPLCAPMASADMSKCGRIVVAGGGIGGAAVAVALQNKGFDVVVLEADASFDARKQGYGLTIQRIDAIQALGLSLVQEDTPCTSHYIFSPEGHILGAFGEALRQGCNKRTSFEGAGRFMHVPRQTLRAKLVDQIHPGTIRWSTKLERFSCWSDDGSHCNGDDHKRNGVTVTLTDGSSMDADLLVGADGIFSTVRRQLSLPGDRLNYLGLIVVLGYVPTGEIEAFPLPQHRIFETVDGVTRIYAMPFTASITMWQLSFPYAEEAARSLVKDPATLKAEILRRCGQWHEPVPDLLNSTPLDCMSGYPVYDRAPLDPNVLRKLRAPATTEKAQSKSQRRVTMLGDAAHPMCPFRAQGANQALTDAVLLADTLENSVRRHGPQSGLDVALPLFERKMLSRSARVVLASREKAKELHSSLAMQPARKVQREVGVDMPEILRALRAKGIGATSAANPKGLDAIVAEVMDASGLGETSTATTAAANNFQVKGTDLVLAEATEGEQELNTNEVIEKRTSTKRKAAVLEEEKQIPGARLDSDWWKTMTFDGYTGEEWEAWYTQEDMGTSSSSSSSSSSASSSASLTPRLVSSDQEDKHRRAVKSDTTTLLQKKRKLDYKEDPEWWKTLTFDGYTGEQWAAWYTAR